MLDSLFFISESEINIVLSHFWFTCQTCLNLALYTVGQFSILTNINAIQKIVKDCHINRSYVSGDSLVGI